MKKILTALLCAALILLFPCAAYAAPDTPATEASFYSADYSGVLSEETCKAIVAANQSLRTETGAEIVIFTTTDTDSITCEEYAALIGENWKVGSKQYKNGAVVVINTETSEAAVCFGAGNEELTTQATALLASAVTPETVSAGYDAAVLEYFNSLVALVREKGEGGELSYYKKSNDYTFTGFRQNAAGGMGEKQSPAFVAWTIIFFALCAALVITVVIFAHRRNYKDGNGWKFPLLSFLFAKEHGDNTDRRRK